MGRRGHETHADEKRLHIKNLSRKRETEKRKLFERDINRKVIIFGASVLFSLLMCTCIYCKGTRARIESGPDPPIAPKIPRDTTRRD